MLHRLGPWPSPKPDLSNYPPDTAAPEPDHQRFSEVRGLKATIRHEPPRSKDSIQIRTLKNEASQSGVEDFSTDGRLSTEAPRTPLHLRVLASRLAQRCMSASRCWSERSGHDISFLGSVH